MRVLSGIQPTGPIHWGNYFGAIRQYIDLQDNEQAYYFIANLHALTTVRDPAKLRQYTLDAALDLLALGLDPNKATLFVQSDVPEVSELCWLLMTGTPMGLLERCHAYKDKKAKGLPADAGLFTYPVLQAADILAYDTDTVPVGEDQVQHIEVCRDLAGSFNHHFGERVRAAQGERARNSAHVPGTDGEKMSKSYNNTLDVFEDAKVAAQEDHADRHRLAADGPAEGAGRRRAVRSVFARRDRSRARGDGRALSPRRLRLRRSQESPGRRRRKILGRAASPPRRAGRQARAHPRNPRRRRRKSPQESRPKCFRRAQRRMRNQMYGQIEQECSRLANEIRLLEMYSARLC